MGIGDQANAKIGDMKSQSKHLLLDYLHMILQNEVRAD